MILRRLVPVLLVAMLVAGCSDGDPGDGAGSGAVAGAGGGDARPSVAEIAAGIADDSGDFGEFDAAIADCVAAVYHDSDLSDEALRALVDGDEDFEPSEADVRTVRALSGDLAACVG